MSTEEFELQFDVLYNNISSNQAPELNDYEKSVFLTKAQEELIKNYFSGHTTKHQTALDDSIKRQADFGLLEIWKLSERQDSDPPFAYGAKVYEYPEDIFLTVNEQLIVTDKEKGEIPYTIMPISYGEYSRLMAKPYKYPPKYTAWRLFTKGTDGAKRAELICKAKGDYSYTIRYLRFPEPIILGNIEDEYGVTIHGKGIKQTCKLPEELHEEILQRAVELAKIAWQGDVDATINSGQRSE